MKINMLDLKREMQEIGQEIFIAIGNSIEETAFINGPRVKELERSVQRHLGVKHAIGVANGTDALVIALRAAGVKTGDEVITTSFTFFATVEACAAIGAVPVFVDVHEDTFNINYELIEEKITPKTKAILPVHLFGLACEIEKIMYIADKHNLAVVEDCAQSFGAAAYNRQKTGTFGKVSTLSFYPTKNLGCYGDGGMVLTNDDKVAADVRRLKEHGSVKRYYHEVIGYNSRLDDIQAAILEVKLRYIDDFLTARKRIAKRYRELLGKKVRYQFPGPEHTYHQFTIRVGNRDELAQALTQADIASSIFYPVPCHLQEAVKYLGYKEGDLPITEKLAKEVLSLPIHQYLRDNELEFIAQIVVTFAK